MLCSIFGGSNSYNRCQMFSFNLRDAVALGGAYD